MPDTDTDIVITARLTFAHEDGPQIVTEGGASPEEIVLDWFAGEYGKQNGAKRPLTLRVAHPEDETVSIYSLELVDAEG